MLSLICNSMSDSLHVSCASAGKGEGMTITPYAAGHLLGGTIWKITKDTEGQRLLLISVFKLLIHKRLFWLLVMH
jgi:predicted MFS family arabinose efflux permease